MKKLLFLLTAVFAAVNAQARECVHVAIEVGDQQEHYTWKNEHVCAMFTVMPCENGACVDVCVTDATDATNVLHRGTQTIEFGTRHSLAGMHEGTEIEFFITTVKSDVTRCTMSPVVAQCTDETVQDQTCTESCAA